MTDRCSKDFPHRFPSYREQVSTQAGRGPGWRFAQRTWATSAKTEKHIFRKVLGLGEVSPKHEEKTNVFVLKFLKASACWRAGPTGPTWSLWSVGPIPFVPRFFPKSIFNWWSIALPRSRHLDLIAKNQARHKQILLKLGRSSLCLASAAGSLVSAAGSLVSAAGLLASAAGPMASAASRRPGSCLARNPKESS